MKFLCDVHISYFFSKYLIECGFDSIHVNFILNRWHSQDSEISEYADKNDLILITKDMDFKNSHFLLSKPRKLIRIVLGNISNEDLVNLFNKHLTIIKDLAVNSKFYLEISKSSTYFVT